MQKQSTNIKSSFPLEEKEIMYEIEEIVVKKIYDIKADLNRHYSDIVKHDDDFLNQAYEQLEVVCHNQLKRLDDWKDNYINSTNMTYDGTSEIIERQKDAANKDASQRILDYIAFKAKLLIDQFPEQAEYFKKLGWKSPIIIPETFKYPFRPDAIGSSADFKGIMFPEFENNNNNGYKNESDYDFDASNPFESSNEFENDDNINENFMDISKNDQENTFNDAEVSSFGNFNQSDTINSGENTSIQPFQSQSGIDVNSAGDDSKIEGDNNLNFENSTISFDSTALVNDSNAKMISNTQNNNQFDAFGNNENNFNYPHSLDNSNHIEKNSNLETKNNFPEQGYYGITNKTEISNDLSSHILQSIPTSTDSNNFDTKNITDLTEDKNNEDRISNNETHFSETNQFNEPLNDSNLHNPERSFNEEDLFVDGSPFNEQNQNNEENQNNEDTNKKDIIEEEEEEEDQCIIENDIDQPVLTARIVLGQIKAGDNAILNLPEGLALYGKIESFDRYSIRFVTDEDEEMSIPTSQFEDKRFFFQSV